MVNYEFYTNDYLGNSISEASFTRLAIRASAQLEKYKKSYTITSDKLAQDMAICAMADALCYYEMAANGGITTSVTVGSVSTSKSSAQLPNTSPKAVSAQLYKCACLYLDIYRG